ncbi:hypothetical protein NQ318_020133 [Aromia moschata]|uniref:RRM domain-containing protein n=1 Tax=Aromia moschata TaxID=1265417 RepID=A0AAV8Z9A3_9CUCU|nr:hypothetical protein NQ318_020133 [Aromia moschata]
MGRLASAGGSPPASCLRREKKRRLSSSCEDKAEDAAEKPKKTLRKVKLIRNPSRGTDDNPDESAKPSSVQRRRKWNNSDWFDRLTSSFYKIDVDAIKIACPSLNFLGEDEVRLEEVSRPEGDLRRKMSIDDDRPAYEKQTSAESVSELDTNIIAMNRKISIVDDTASKLKPPPSPAKSPPSDVLYITNLVRPFTVKQLRELLERTGKIVEDGFWTDRIKSKCYVRYESVEEAEATRNALHGVHWPIGNGKQLVIDFATVEDLEKASKPAPAPKPVVDKVPEKENREPEKPEEMFKEREREKEEKRRRDGPVREWDLGKEEPRRPHSRSRSRSRERARKHSRRSYTPEDYAHRKQRKVEEPVPQKLMDDLFLKTKATPSIYWQPLSPEEIATKQKQRLVRMEEHKRRIEETRVRLRENRRGSFRRR